MKKCSLTIAHRLVSAALVLCLTMEVINSKISSSFNQKIVSLLSSVFIRTTHF